MRARLSTLRTPLFALGVALSLAFGAGQALAEAAAGPNVCPRTSVGRCNTTERCQQTCADLGGTGGECRSGCCYCPLAI